MLRTDGSSRWTRSMQSCSTTPAARSAAHSALASSAEISAFNSSPSILSAPTISLSIFDAIGATILVAMRASCKELELDDAIPASTDGPRAGGTTSPACRDGRHALNSTPLRTDF